jgi:ferrochelatase
MGGPSSLDEVKPYLKSIFDDPLILTVPGFIRKPLSTYIVSKRLEKVKARYTLIGGKSPLLGWTQKLEAGLKDCSAIGSDPNFDEISYAFRYSAPLIGESIGKLIASGMDELYLLPLFPHNAKAMTGSIVIEAQKALKNTNLKLTVLPAFGQAEKLISLQNRYVAEAITDADPKIHVLFVAHGIPQRSVDRGEDYPIRVADTARAISHSLPETASWSLAFQSRLGPVKWTEPYIEDAIVTHASADKTLVMVPLSFVADCLETLYDLDTVAKELAMKVGYKRVIRVRTYNDDPKFAKILLKIATSSS